MCAAPVGNQFYKNVEFPGAPPKFATPEALWIACNKYFKDADEEQVFKTEAKVVSGEVVLVNVPKSVPYSLGRLQLYIGVMPQTWLNWKTEGDHFRKDLLEVIEWVEKIIREQQLRGASTDMFNANIVSRLLGLVDKKEVEQQASLTIQDPAEHANKVAQKILEGHK